jgi:hypothetical protein
MQQDIGWWGYKNGEMDYVQEKRIWSILRITGGGKEGDVSQ